MGEIINSISNIKRRKKVQILDVLISLILIVLCVISLLNYNFFKTRFIVELMVYGGLGLFLTSFFLEFFPQVLNPFILVFVGISLSMNVHFVILLAILGSVAGSIFGFEVGKKHGWRFIYPLFTEITLTKTLKFWNKHGRWFVLVSAITPLPYFPLVFGALNMPRKDFFLFGILTRVLGLLVAGYAYYFGFFQYNF